MTYNYFKLVHLIAVIVFLGNIFTGLFWMHIAIKTKDLKIISHSIKGVIKSDRLFTIPGVILITSGGLVTAIYGHIPIIHTGWIFLEFDFIFNFRSCFCMESCSLAKKNLSIDFKSRKPG